MLVLTIRLGLCRLAALEYMAMDHRIRCIVRDHRDGGRWWNGQLLASAGSLAGNGLRFAARVCSPGRGSLLSLDRTQDDRDLAGDCFQIVDGAYGLSPGPPELPGAIRGAIAQDMLGELGIIRVSHHKVQLVSLNGELGRKPSPG